MRNKAQLDPYLQVILQDPRPHIFEPRANWATPFDDIGFGDAGCPKEWAYIPLISRGQVIGKLSVDNYRTGKPLKEGLTHIASFATQAVTAIEAAHWAHTLAIFNRVAAAVSSTLDIEEVLTRTCQAAQELFQVSHSGLLILMMTFT